MDGKKIEIRGRLEKFSSKGSDMKGVSENGCWGNYQNILNKCNVILLPRKEKGLD